MKIIFRVVGAFLVAELMLALLAYHGRPALAVPPEAPQGAIRATVLIPKQVRHIHRVVRGWVYGPATGQLFRDGDTVALLDGDEDRFVRQRAAAGQIWTPLSMLGLQP